MAGLRRNTETMSGAIWRIKSGSSIEGRAGHASYFCRGVTRHRVMLFYRRVTRHHGVFLHFSLRHRRFTPHVTCHTFSNAS